jgi:hypothetical protein
MYALQQTLLKWSNKGGWIGRTRNMYRGMHTKFWSGNMKGRDQLEDLDVNGRMKLMGCEA